LLINELEGSMNDLPVNGIVLMSTVINSDLGAGDLRYVELLPSFASTAWYHEKIDRARWNGDREAFLNEVRAFAIKEYAPALLQGQLVSPSERENAVDKVSAYAGLSREFVAEKDFRVSGDDFRKELLRKEGFTIGHFDTRYKVPPKAIIAMPGQPGADPAGFGVESAYTTAMLDYYYNKLNVDIEDKYLALNIGLPWRSEKGPQPDDVSKNIARALRENSDLRVLQAGGLYDLATPFFATDMAFSQMGFDRSRIKITYYDGGHMMYTHRPSLEQLSDYVHEFVRAGAK
jgi:carboxypeptidase C (cathepsin A)